MKLPTLVAGDQQQMVLMITASLSVIVVLFMAYVMLQTRKDIPYEEVSTKGYSYRRPWGIFLVILLVIVGAISFANMPSGMMRDKKADATIKVTAMQFGFTFDREEVPAGKRVAFEIQSIDVNHGVGIYSPKGELLGQAQAMPGRVNRLVLDIDKPGTYYVLCMEYCGLFHHNMTSQFKATKQEQA